ncbi:hypothetical protein E2C01_059058 [Portunus trituberculatus]|uniref:Uncharacterized protein n=1 Tax=Portunus trituberculatus TaxID=210409 RepID=A0A5B7H4T6_PORTR|nr:hypothetical protein [Portunus trituberculatus]
MCQEVHTLTQDMPTNSVPLKPLHLRVCWRAGSVVAGADNRALHVLKIGVRSRKEGRNNGYSLASDKRKYSASDETARYSQAFVSSSDLDKF